MTKKIFNLNFLFPLFFSAFLIIALPVKGQDLCPPAFLEGLSLNGAIELNWQEPDSLGGLGDEVFSACFPVCATAAEGFTIEHIGQDTSGGWFQDSDGEPVDCGSDMYACADGGSDGFGAIAIYSDTLAPVNSRLSTGLIDLSAYASAFLVFEEYYLYSDFSHDSNWVEISTDGSNWTPVFYSDPMTYGDGYAISGVDISNYAGQSIHIGFRFYDSIGYNENWQIDNIRVFGGDGSDFANPCGTLTGYNIYSGGSLVGSSETNSYTVTGLTNNVEYCYSVTAVYSEGESAECVQGCFAPVDPFELTQSSFRDTLDYSAGEYSVFEFSLINSDTANHDFHFESEVILEATSDNTLLADDFNTGASSNFFPSDSFWTIGTVEDANGLYLTYPEDSDGAFYFHNDGESWYTTNDSTNSILQSQAIPYTGAGPVFFYVDMYFPQPYGGCANGGIYSEDASIVVSTDNGANWTVVDSTFRTAVTWSGYYAYDNTEANWHTLMYNITPYIEPGIFNVGIHYDDCGGNWSSGIGVDNLQVIQGDETNWLSWERLSGEIISGDTMSMSLSMMPQQDQNEYETATLYLEGMTMSQAIDIDMITDPENAGVDHDALPNKYALYQNYPNPFNPVTTLRYNLPKDQMVNIAIYDMMGRTVRNLINSHETAGYKSIQWDAANDAGVSVSAGLYLYRIQAGDFVQTRKMVLLK